MPGVWLNKILDTNDGMGRMLQERAICPTIHRGAVDTIWEENDYEIR